MNKIEGIIISEERHNELLAKEVKADANTVSLFIPEKLIKFDHGYIKTSFEFQKPELVGEFPDKEAAVNHIKTQLQAIIEHLKEKEVEADWRYKQRMEKESELKMLREQVDTLELRLKSYKIPQPLFKKNLVLKMIKYFNKEKL